MYIYIYIYTDRPDYVTMLACRAGKNGGQLSFSFRLVIRQLKESSNGRPLINSGTLQPFETKICGNLLLHFGEGYEGMGWGGGGGGQNR